MPLPGPTTWSHWPLAGLAGGLDVASTRLRGQVTWAEEPLDPREVGAALGQGRGERVAERVGVGDEPAQRARVEAAAAHRDEERVRGAARQLRAGIAEVAAQP